MSDSKLRELERRWKETGSVEDELTYLRETARAGALPGARGEVATAFTDAVLRNLDRRPLRALRVVLSWLKGEASIQDCALAAEQAAEASNSSEELAGVSEALGEIAGHPDWGAEPSKNSMRDAHAAMACAAVASIPGSEIDERNPGEAASIAAAFALSAAKDNSVEANWQAQLLSRLLLSTDPWPECLLPLNESGQ